MFTGGRFDLAVASKSASLASSRSYGIRPKKSNYQPFAYNIASIAYNNIMPVLSIFRAWHRDTKLEACREI
jgi:hypothetical protein